MSEVMGGWTTTDSEWVLAVEAGLWEQVWKESALALVPEPDSPKVDSRGVLADFYEDHDNYGMAWCVRWCVTERRVCHKAWFNGDYYSEDDCNNLPGELFSFLEGWGVPYHKSDYSSFYPSTKDAYVDLLRALRKLGYV